MTIIAGFRCLDGIVLCAESEYTVGQVAKENATKIAQIPIEDSAIVMAGCGSGYFMQAVFERVRDCLKSQKTTDRRLPSVKEIFRKQLTAIYQQHVYPVPNWESMGIDGQFLIAARLGNGDRELWTTYTTYIIEASQYDFQGQGIDLASCLAHSLCWPDMEIKDATVAATIIIKQVKAFVPYCGGQTMVFIVPNHGEAFAQSPEETRKIENYFDELQQATRHVVMGWRSPDRPALQQVLDTFGSKVERAWEELKREP